MKWINYSRYTGEDFGIDADDLLRALSDFLLQSGFNAQYMQFSEWNEHTLEELKNAIQRALEEGKLFSNENLRQMMEQLEGLSPEQLEQLVNNLVQKLVDEGHITMDDPQNNPQHVGGQAGMGPQSKIKFFSLWRMIRDRLLGIDEAITLLPQRDMRIAEMKQRCKTV